ncbi:MAG: quinone-dependent dihydroorotate dehydrogenase [Acetobacteraceae bacterium]
MRAQVESAVLSCLRRMDPEWARELALLAIPLALRFGLMRGDTAPDDPVLRVVALGKPFRNPIGLAAGFDKDAVAVVPLMQLGFGSVEVGSITPLPQAGNPRPRIFRLAEDRAIVNRMGMNSQGIERVRRRLANVGERPAVLGVNVAINKDTSVPEHDYTALVAAVAPYADYVAINVSSPNTPGLRDLQAAPRLGSILAAIAAGGAERPSILVKIAPDLGAEELAAVVEAAVGGGASGLIVGNTTITRPTQLRSKEAREAGGLSGAPLYALSTTVLARVFLLSRGRLTLIGCGGVSTGAEALGKIRAGASLVQIHTAFSYEGSPLIPRIKRELAAELRKEGFSSVAEAVGVDAAGPARAERVAHAA